MIHCREINKCRLAKYSIVARARSYIQQQTIERNDKPRLQFFSILSLSLSFSFSLFLSRVYSRGKYMNRERSFVIFFSLFPFLPSAFERIVVVVVVVVDRYSSVNEG